jgi:iron uptake system component EfeO
MSLRRTRTPAAVVVLGLTAALAACTPNEGTVDGRSATVTVDSSADACTVSTDTAPSGTVVFEVTNTGDDVTEFYLLAEDGLRIISEVENIGPGITRTLVIGAAPGEYLTACKPGMVGEGIRARFTVTDSGAAMVLPDDAEAVEAAAAAYLANVEDQTEQLLTETQAFVDAYLAGDDDAARSRYAPARVHWERIEPVAESFGDLDPRMDLREADLEAGQVWTGWHVIEKDLWPPLPETNGGSQYVPFTPDERERFAAQLVADTEDLSARVHAEDFVLTVDQIGNGAKSLLDEVATGKVTGEEEIWSHTDLWDFQANVDGARVAYDGLRALAEAKDPDLAATLDERFAAIQNLLDGHRQGDGFRLYTELSADEVRELAAAVDALGEPLSRLTAAVVL